MHFLMVLSNPFIIQEPSNEYMKSKENVQFKNMLDGDSGI